MRLTMADPTTTPSAIAATRANSYTRFTQLSIIQCLLDYADTEFARDSAESVARARTLYLTALELLDSGNLGRSAADCQAEIDDLDAEISAGITNNDPQWQPLWNEAKFILGRIGERHQLESAIKAVRAAVTAHDDFVPGIIGALKAVTATSDRTPTGSKVSRLIADREQQNSEIYATGRLATVWAMPWCSVSKTPWAQLPGASRILSCPFCESPQYLQRRRNFPA